MHFLGIRLILLGLLSFGLIMWGYPPAFAEKKTDTQSKNADQTRERASRLLQSIDSLLEETAKQRSQTRKLPSKNDYFVAVPPWTETKEDRQNKIRNLLDSVLEVITDAPIVEFQSNISQRRKNIREIEDQIARLKEKRLDAPKESMLPSILTDTVNSIDSSIKDMQKRIEENKKDITATKTKIHNALKTKGIEMSEEQLDLLMGSVLSGDIVKLVAAFDAARVIDDRLGRLMGENSENLESARRYFAMHAALFAMLLHAQDELLNKIDTIYLKRIREIIRDIQNTRAETRKLLRQKNRADQRRTLLANSEAQDFSERVATFYRDYLRTQREQIMRARRRTLRDLRIADNTYETVEASFQLRALIEDAKASFEAIQRLEAPGFDQIFKNKELRKEFESITRKLAPTS